MREFALSCVICVCVIAAAGFAASNDQAGADAPKGNPEARKLKNPVSATPASITAGEALYKKYCQFCHGPTGRGDGAQTPKGMEPANLTDAVWDRGDSDGEIFTVIQEGAGPKFQMKGLKGKLSPPDTWHVVNYVRKLGADAK
jgi:mono/diheme cytochrome c family protein